MVLTKEELINALQHEIRILLHLATKVDRAKLDYRPTPKQRSTLELLQYLAIMGPTQVSLVKHGKMDMEAMKSTWTPIEAAAKAMSFDEAVSTIERQMNFYASELQTWSDADFRANVDMFGHIFSRGSLLVTLVLNSHALYRMQLFLYLKSSGREELNTMNLMGAMDAVAAK